MNEQLYLGIEIGGTKLQVVLGNDHAAILDRRRFAVDPGAGSAGIQNQIAQALADFLRHHRISGVGIGFGGPVDWRTGKICRSYHVEGWTGFAIGSWMEDIARVPVRVDNDANTAALAEALRGAGDGHDPVFYITLGSGVGGGLVSGGAIWHGAIPGESEIGHLRLDKGGTIVEARCSGWSVDKRIRAEIAAQPDSKLAQLVGATAGSEAKHMRKAVESNDPLAIRILEETADDLAFAISHVTHLMHPEVIVLGGGLSLTGEALRQRVERNVGKYLMDAFLPGPKISLASLGEDVVPVGALLLAKQSKDSE
ncbi:MAG TPA: ROK family protein [Verrucomicrobiae bacterium]|nr:ROK family protein [Verrucomicrobiae bacterium]